MGNKLDKLFREKWESGDIPFRDRYWTEMEEVLDRNRKRRPAAWLWLAGALLLASAIGGTVWYQSNMDSGMAVGQNKVVSELSEIDNYLNENTGSHSTEEKTRDRLMEKEAGMKEQRPVADGLLERRSVPDIRDEAPIRMTTADNRIYSSTRKTPERERRADEESADAITQTGLESKATITGVKSIPPESRLENTQPLTEDDLTGLYPVPALAKPHAEIAIPDLIPLAFSPGPISATVEITPTVLSRNSKFGIALGAGYAWVPMSSNHMHGPYLSAELSWRTGWTSDLSLEMEIGHLAGEFDIVDQNEAEAFSFGIGRKMQTIEPTGIYSLRIPLRYSHRFSRWRAGLGLGMDLLLGARGERKWTEKFEDFSPGNQVSVTTINDDLENIWIDKEYWNELRLFASGSLEWLWSARSSIELQIEYATDNLDRIQDEENVSSENSRLRLSVGAKYYLK